MSTNDVRKNYVAAIEEHSDASSKLNVKRIVNDADARCTADALADGIAESSISIRVGMYKESRDALKEAQAVAAAAREKYEAAKKIYNEVTNRSNEETA